MEQEELIERDLPLTVQLPGGQERAVTVHGSKPVMDLLITLCAQYHLNPSDHIIELISTNQNQIKFKPNSLIGSLEAERVVLKNKGDDTNRRVSNMPVATVRLMINYRQSHKAVVRVNPRVPLAELMPAVCEKCEFDPDATILLRDSHSEDPLDLTKTLNDYGIREVYAKDTKICKEGQLGIREKRQRNKENKGFLRLFRRSKKTAEEGVVSTGSVPTSPAPNKQHVVSISCLKGSSPTSTPPADLSKKRRAPQPPSLMGSQSFPCGLNSSQSFTLLSDPASGKQGGLSRVSSTESSLKRTKRRAPPPPCPSSSVPDCNGIEKGASFNFASLEEAQEEEDVPTSVSCSNQYSDFTVYSPTQSHSLMTEILSEFMDVMRTEEQRELSPERSLTYSPPAVNNSHSPQSDPSSPASPLDPDAIAPPSGHLWRNCSHREGLTTFTVVPQRRRPSLRQYEILLTLEASDCLERSDGETEVIQCPPKHGENPEKGIGSIELCKNELVNHKCNDEHEEEGLEVRDKSAYKAVGKLELNTDTETLFAEESEETEDQVSEDGDFEDRDWVEEFRARRMRFQEKRDDREVVKLDGWMKEFEEGLSFTVMEDEKDQCENDFPPPPLDVYWKENERDCQEDEEETNKVRSRTEGQEEDQDVSTIHPNPPNHQPVADIFWDVNSILNSSDSNFDSAEPQLEVALTYLPPDTVQSVSNSNPHSSANIHQSSSVPNPHTSSSHLNPTPQPTCDLPAPAPVSLFALAVSRRVQSLMNGVCPLTPSRQRSYSQTQSCSMFYYQNPSSQRPSHCIQSAQAVRNRAWSSPSSYAAEKEVQE
ncbi:uncharacterized protein cobll1a isoform X2 [Hoplias malabaricus]|uniref:uncharacterized protein cobll1a isoform X2 n=1 Tax=Hoplias malabaricus TaxID=27720 RepID=UPI00346292DA